MDNGHTQPKTTPDTITNEEAKQWLQAELLGYTDQIPEVWREAFDEQVRRQMTIPFYAEEAKSAMQSEGKTTKKEWVRYCLQGALNSMPDLGLVDISPFGKIMYPPKIRELFEIEIYRHTAPESSTRAITMAMLENLGIIVNKYELSRKIDVHAVLINKLIKKLNEAQDAFQIAKYFNGECLRLEPTIAWLVEMEEKHAAEVQHDDPEVIKALRVELDNTRQALAKALKERDDATAKVKKLEKEKKLQDPKSEPPAPPVSALEKTLFRKAMLDHLRTRCNNKLTMRILQAIVEHEGSPLAYKLIVAYAGAHEDTKQQMIERLTQFARNTPNIFGEQGMAQLIIEELPTGEPTFIITPRPGVFVQAPPRAHQAPPRHSR